MWREVVHEKNVMNDAKFLNSKMVHDRDLLQREFAIDENVTSGIGLYLFDFLPRYGRTLMRVAKEHLSRKN